MNTFAFIISLCNYYMLKLINIIKKDILRMIEKFKLMKMDIIYETSILKWKSNRQSEKSRE